MTKVIRRSPFQCQNTYLEEQLKSGIRYLDFNLRLNDEMVEVYHAGVNTEFSLQDVIGFMCNFLDEYPTEALIIRIHKESLRTGSKKRLERPMFRDWKASGIRAERAKSHLYTTDSGTVLAAPTLGSLRGKILLLEDFKVKTPDTYGIPWKSNAVVVSTSKLTLGDSGLASKWDTVQSGLAAANVERENKLHITHTGVNLGFTSIVAAAGKEPGEGLNDRLGGYLNSGNIGRTGIVVMDFPGKELVGEIIKRNDAFLS